MVMADVVPVEVVSGKEGWKLLEAVNCHNSILVVFSRVEGNTACYRVLELTKI
jgi:hypothetical protein